MNKNYTILILTIIFIGMVGGLTYLMFFNEYTETVNFDGTTLNLPHTFFDKIQKYNDSNGAYVIENPDKYTIKYFYWGDNNLIDAVNFGKEKIGLVGQTNNTGPNPVKTTYNGETVYVCFTSEIEHGNLLIISKNPETAKKIYNSIKSKPKNNTKSMPDNLDNSNKNNQSQNNITNNQNQAAAPVDSDDRRITPSSDSTPSPDPSPTPTNRTAKVVKV